MLKRNEKGFTLIEMLVVLFIVAILVLLTIPNVTKHLATIDERGCQAYKSMIESQIQVYKLNTGSYPTSFTQLIAHNYIKGEPKNNGMSLLCPNNVSQLVFNTSGDVPTVAIDDGS